MHCHRCGREMADAAAFCQFCGARRQPEDRPALRRSQVDRQIAGLCGGIARYLDVDPVFVRVLWVVLTIVPGTILLGLLAYAVGWLIVPEAAHGTEPVITSGVGGRKRLQRSTTDVTIGGVCGGIAEYFQVDATAVRLLWVVLSVFPGLLVGGVLVYVLVWLIMPAAPQPVAQAQAGPQPEAPPPPPPPPASDAAGAAARE